MSAWSATYRQSEILEMHGLFICSPHFERLGMIFAERERESRSLISLRNFPRHTTKAKLRFAALHHFRESENLLRICGNLFTNMNRYFRVCGNFKLITLTVGHTYQ